MAKLPAEMVGGLELLLKRLQAGQADAADQQWAAKLLERANLPPRTTEQRVRQGQDWQIFYSVQTLVDSGLSRDAAYAALEGTLPARYQSRGNSRSLNRETIKARFLAMEKLNAELEAWAEENPELVNPDRFEDS